MHRYIVGKLIHLKSSFRRAVDAEKQMAKQRKRGEDGDRAGAARSGEG